MEGKKSLTYIFQKFVNTGDQEWYTELYDKSKTHIFMIAYRYMKNSTDAEDVVQDIFLQIFDKYEKYKDVENYVSWVAKITRNNCLRRLGKIKRQNTEVKEIKDKDLGNRVVRNEAEGKIDKERIDNIIQNLRPIYYKEILNYEIDGYSNPEIALKIGKTQKYVRDRKCLARKVLKEHLRGANLI